MGPRRELLQKALDSSEEWNSKVLDVLAEANARQVRSDGQEAGFSIGSADRHRLQAAHLTSGWGWAQLGGACLAVAHDVLRGPLVTTITKWNASCTRAQLQGWQACLAPLVGKRVPQAWCWKLCVVL